MHILIVSATHFEIGPLLEHLGIASPQPGLNKGATGHNGIRADVLITGVGMVNTAVNTAKFVSPEFDLALNVGICGAFDRSLLLGQLVNITSDVISEMGAQDGDDFLPYDQMDLPGSHRYQALVPQTIRLADALPRVTGITVNTVHGNDASISNIHRLYQPQVESMEGAAFFAACQGVTNALQIRSVSNYVEKRDKSKWQIPLAITNLNTFLIDNLTSLMNSIPNKTAS